MNNDPTLLGVTTTVIVIVLAVASSRLRRAVTAQRRMARLKPPGSASIRMSVVVPAGAAVLLLVLVAAHVPKLLVVLVPVMAASWWSLRSEMIARHRRAYERDLPEVLEMVASNVRSGANLLGALQDAAANASGPVADDVARICTRVHNGSGLADALSSWQQSSSSASVRLASSSMFLAHKSGAAHARALDGIVMTLRRNLQAAETLRVYATQSVASAWALTCLPVLFTGSMTLIDGEIRSFMTETWTGIGLLGAGLLLDVAGFAWMNHLIRKATQR